MFATVFILADRLHSEGPTKYAYIVSTPVPQTEPLNESQVRNNASGFVFKIGDWARLDRFLVLGCDAPTYYQNATSSTRENAQCVERCYDADPARTVDRIVEISRRRCLPSLHG